MPEPKSPILLDYKTPEKGERITAWMVTQRTLTGLFGIAVLLIALELSFNALEYLPEKTPPYQEADKFMVLVMLALITWIAGFCLLIVAITGYRKSHKAPIESDK